jgi:hypothetical protein
LALLKHFSSECLTTSVIQLSIPTLPDAGIQWQTVIDDFILSLGFSIIPGLPQLFKQQSDSKNPPTILAKVTDDILLVGTESALESFIQNIRASFDVGLLQCSTTKT